MFTKSDTGLIRGPVIGLCMLSSDARRRYTFSNLFTIFDYFQKLLIKCNKSEKLCVCERERDFLGVETNNPQLTAFLKRVLCF